MDEEQPQNRNRRYGVLPLEIEVPKFDVPVDKEARTSLEEFHKRLSEMHRHEDGLFNSRLQGFLVATSLLVAAFSQFRESIYVKEAVFLAIVGVSFSLTLAYVLRRTAVAIQWYIATLRKIEIAIWPENHRPYDTRRLLRGSSARIPITAILGVYVPWAAVAFWVVMGCYAMYRDFVAKASNFWV